MSATLTNLWPESIRVNVQSPLVILRTQAEALGTMTQGILEGIVDITREGKTGDIRLDLLVSSRSLNYKHQILVANHRRDLPYPVTVTAECYEPGGSRPHPVRMSLTTRTATNPDEFTELVKEVLASPEVEVVVVSLLARSNDPEAERQFAELDKTSNGD